MNDDFISIKEAAKIAGKTVMTIRSWIDKGYLNKFQSGLQVGISRSELLEFIKPKKI